MAKMKFWGVKLLILLIVLGCKTEKKGGEQETMNTGKSLEGKKIVMVIAHENFRDEELLVPKKHLSALGAEVTIASTELTQASGMLGATVTPDMLVKDVNPADYDMVAFIGGSGVQNIWDRKDHHELAKKADSLGKPIAAICLAPAILAKAGILKGKKATVYESAKNHLEAGGANYAGEGVIQDGRIITATGPQYAEQFAKTIEKVLAK